MTREGGVRKRLPASRTEHRGRGRRVARRARTRESQREGLLSLRDPAGTFHLAIEYGL